MKVPHPSKNSCFYPVVEFFVNRLNFCEGEFYGTGEPKPRNPVYEWLWDRWLWPFDQNGCVCCNTVRGLVYGFIIGFATASFF